MKNMNIFRALIITAVLFLFSGCGNKKIDSSTDENFKDSITAVKSQLSTEKKKEFEEAIRILSFSAIGNLFAAVADPDGVQRKVRDKLHGKTADEIIAEARRIKAEKEKERKKERVARQKAELEEKRLATEKLKIAPKGAFGIKFGDVYTPPAVKSRDNTGSLTTGEAVYFIGAPQGFRKFKDLTLLITPKTHKIYSIWSSAKLDSKGKAEAEYEIISGMLAQKYKMKPERRICFGGDACSLDFEISDIFLRTHTLYKSSVEIRYTDTKLAELAKKERLEIESKKSDDSAL